MGVSKFWIVTKKQTHSDICGVAKRCGSLKVTAVEGGQSSFAKHKLSSEMKILTYNILNDGSSRLQIASRRMCLTKVDLSFLTEKRIVKGSAYARECEGYTVVVSEARSKDQGEILLFSKSGANFHVQGFRRSAPT